jgi:serine/threonine protein kinase/Flp pilus assembly protein TadD
MEDMVGKKISHYKILEKLGEGGMGVVYKAEDTDLKRNVAIKFLPTHLSGSDENKQRFFREARSAAALNHPNILGIYEISEQANSLFLVMEFVDGVTLKSHINSLGSGTGVPVTQAFDWIEQIAQGLKCAHDLNIIHRDIKTENIMISKDGRLKIMDFGLAKLKGDAGITKTKTSVGTLSYMSPEQAHAIPADHRCDIWSLGVVFYEILTGELPFKAEHEAGLIYLIMNEEPPAPSTLNRKVPQQLDVFVRKMMQKDREKRFNNVDELLKELNAIRSGAATNAAQNLKKSIAVLPFDNIGTEKENEYFGDGLTEELIVNLSKLNEIDVVSRTTSMAYKDAKKDTKTVGRELNVRYILEGSVRKFQDNIRITVQLIDVESDRQLWAEAYKGKLEDVFDIQEQVSKQIVDALMLKLSPKEKVVLTKRPTLNADAFDCNLRARNHLYRRTKNNLEFAIQLFQKAIEFDPRYASAYAGLGEAYATLHHDYDSKEVWLDKAMESAFKALMYDPTLSEAYAALGLTYFSKKMIDEAITSSQKAIEFDPSNFVAYWILGRIYHTTDRDNEAIDLFKKAIELNPDFHNSYDDLRMVYEGLGEIEKKQEILNKLMEIFPRYLSKHPDDARSHIYYATDLAQVGRTEEAKVEAAKALELSPGDPLMLYNAACCYARMNENKLAIDALRKSMAAGLEDIEWTKRDPDLAGLHNEPDFIELMKDK